MPLLGALMVFLLFEDEGACRMNDGPLFEFSTVVMMVASLSSS